MTQPKSTLKLLESQEQILSCLILPGPRCKLLIVQPSAGVLSPQPVGHIQTPAVGHLAHGALHISQNLLVGEQWHHSHAAKFTDLWGALQAR